jgi:hypothetical protein
MAADKNNAAITDTIYQTKNNWVDAVLETVIRAGIEQPVDETTADTTGETTAENETKK